jgi:signal transduction histidine kinase
VDGIHEGAQRIKKIVQTLRDFARRDPGDLSREIDPNAVVDSAVTLVRHLLDKSTDRFSASCDPGIPRIRGSSQQLEQVAVNLLTNACDALPSRDRAIRVSTRFDRQAQRVFIEVADEGTGISAESRMRIFDPFYTTKQDRGGTGLGLSISYTIVRNHGGELTLVSEEGRGTVATVSLPPAGEAPRTEDRR